VRKAQRHGEQVSICAADPVNLVGIVLPGPRVPALPTNSVDYVDGIILQPGDIPAPVLIA
jgi:ATP-dependent Lhr-like helicase